MKTILLGFFIFLLLGCSESAKWRNEASEWRKTADNYRSKIDSLNMEVRILGENMVKASDAIDPAGIKQLYADIRGLQNINRELESRIRQAYNWREGEINLSIEKLRLRVVRYLGFFSANIWIDKKENLVLRNGIYRGNDYVFLDRTDILSSLDAFKAANKVCPTDHTFNSCRLNFMDQMWVAYVNSRFNDYVSKGPFHSPVGSDSHWFLQEQILGPGKKTIYFEISPISSEYSITFVLEKILENDKVETLKTITINGDPNKDKMSIWAKFVPNNI